MKLAKHTQFPVYGCLKQRTYTEKYIYSEEDCILGYSALWSGRYYRLSDERISLFYSEGGCVS